MTSFSRMSSRLTMPTSDVWRVHAEAVKRKSRGDDILLLSVGDPDFDTPQHISDYVVAQIQDGRTHYSPAAGEQELRDTIAKLETEGTGKPFHADQVVIFPGATAALYAVFECILNEGDGVVVPEPMYVGYQGVLDAIGADIQHVPLAPPAFDLDVQAVMGRVEPNTKAVLVNTPGNPCGNIIESEKLTALANACREREIWLICDEVYSLITFDEPHVSMLKSTDDFSNIVVIDGLSKSHAMSGWRVGWVIAEAPMIDALTLLASAALFGVCQFVQDGATFALANDAQDVEAMRVRYEARRNYAIERLDAIPGLSYYKPKAGMFIMIDVSGVANDGASFSERLLQEAGISTVAGAGFGPTAINYVRMSLTLPRAGLNDAFDRIEKMLLP